MACVHHWMIDSPAGPTSKGKCKKCRRVKMFENVDKYDRPQTVGWQKLNDDSAKINQAKEQDKLRRKKPRISQEPRDLLRKAK